MVNHFSQRGTSFGSKNKYCFVTVLSRRSLLWWLLYCSHYAKKFVGASVRDMLSSLYLWRIVIWNSAWCCLVSSSGTFRRRNQKPKRRFKWAASWQNQQNGMCAQRRLRSAWASAQSDQSLRCPRMKKAWVLSYPLSAQRRLWSDWADAQADLTLWWAHMPLCWFCHEVVQIIAILHDTT